MKKNVKRGRSQSNLPKANGVDASRLAKFAPWVVVIVTMLAFAPAVGNDFVNWDDDHNFLNNPDYRGLAPENLSWIFSTFLMGHYHPLTWLTLGTDYALWGMWPGGYHLTSIILHAIGALMVYLLFVELLRLARQEDQASMATRLGAVFGALFFAVHPLRVESVAWASERRDVLCGIFYAATLWLYVRGRRVAPLATFAAALLSKVLAATLPVVLLIVDLYPLRRRLTVSLLIEKVPYVALACGAAFIGVGRYDDGFPGAAGHDEFYIPLRIALSLFGIAFYLWKTLVPFGLYPAYVGGTDPQPFEWQFVAAGVVVLLVTGVTWALRKRYPFALAAWATYLVTLPPVLSFLRLDRQNYVADHHSYLATLGFAALAGGLFAALSSERDRLVLAGAVVAGLATLTFSQTFMWRDSQSLWTHALRGSPLSIVAHNNLARAYAEQGRTQDAIEEFGRAIEIEPAYSHAHYNLASLLMNEGQLAEAENHFQRAAQSLPSPQTFSDWGNCLLRMERPEQAVARYQQALEIRPDFADAHYNLAIALHYMGRVEDAIQHYRSAARLDPTNADAQRSLAALSGAVAF